MKEKYYTDDTIDQEAKSFLQKVLSLRLKHNLKIKAHNAALLVIDCQKFFYDTTSHAFVPSFQAIVPKIVALQTYCFRNNMEVIQTIHSNNENNAQMMGKWWGDHLLGSDNPLTGLVPQIVDERAKIIVKSQYDAFYNSDLAANLQAKNIKQLIITGVMTHLCCETTARAAFTLGYEVFFAIDGTATYNRDFQMATLLNLAHGFAVPILVDEVISELSGT